MFDNEGRELNWEEKYKYLASYYINIHENMLFLNDVDRMYSGRSKFNIYYLSKENKTSNIEYYIWIEEILNMR